MKLLNTTLFAATDLTVLKPTTQQSEIDTLCQSAAEHQFAAVCIPPYFVQSAAQLLSASPVKVATVIDFPYGYSPTPARVEGIKKSIDYGADELDVVINLAALKSGDFKTVANDLDGVIGICRLRSKSIKIIIESGLLTMSELEQVLALCNQLQPTFVKTSTGINGPGADLATVKLMREILDDSIFIKASGGIKDAKMAQQFLTAGADRLGASSALSWK